MPAKSDILAVREIVDAIRGHDHLRREFAMIQSSPLELVIDVPTRWGSTLSMIQRFIKLWEFIRKILLREDIDQYISPDTVSDGLLRRLKV